MGKVPAAILLIVLIWNVGVSQTTARQTKPKKAEHRVAQLERDWSAAFLRHDTTTIARIIADDYVGTDGRGIVTNKTQELEEAMAPRPGDPALPFVILDETVTDMKVRSYGNRWQCVSFQRKPHHLTSGCPLKELQCEQTSSSS